MLAGIGTDIISITRFENLSEHLIERCFTEAEREYLKQKPASSKAGMFAAKEAVVKALGTGFKGFWPSDVEILHGADGQPLVSLHGAAKDTANGKGINKIWVSISHSETDAVAFAAAERTGAQ